MDMEITPERVVHLNAILKVGIYSNIDVWSCPELDLANLKATDAEIEKNLCSTS
jgi:hypothetical protein